MLGNVAEFKDARSSGLGPSSARTSSTSAHRASDAAGSGRYGLSPERPREYGGVARGRRVSAAGVWSPERPRETEGVARGRRVSAAGVEPGEVARDGRRRAGATRVSRWAGAGRAREGALPAEGDQFFFGLIIGRRRPGTLEAAGGAVVVAVAGALAVAEGRADTTGFTVAVVVVVVVGLVVTVTVGVAAVALAGALPASVVPDSSFLPQPTTKAADAPRTRARVENERMFMGGA